MRTAVTKYVETKTNQYNRYQVFKYLHRLQDIVFELIIIETGNIELSITDYMCNDMN
jgi:hypothetical protein